MYSLETEFVKNLRKTHCKGCRDEGDENFRYCDGKSVSYVYKFGGVMGDKLSTYIKN